MFRYENRRMSTKALVLLAKLVNTKPNLVGFELCGHPPQDDIMRLQRWYEMTIEQIRNNLTFTEADEFPIYVNDAGDPEHFAKWVGTRQDFVVLTHALEVQENDVRRGVPSSVAEGVASASRAADGRMVINSWETLPGNPDPRIPAARADPYAELVMAAPWQSVLRELQDLRAAAVRLGPRPSHSRQTPSMAGWQAHRRTRRPRSAPISQ